MSKLVTLAVDTTKPRKLTAAQKAGLERLAAMPDEEIDFSDIPPMTFETVIRFRDRHLHPDFYKPVNRSTTVRIDADVLQSLKVKGKGCRTRLNAILREAMLREVG